MTSVRLKQIGLAICLMASLLTAAPAACTCSHHETPDAVETDCHSSHEAAETTQASQDLDAVDQACVCVAADRAPILASKSVSKNLRSQDAAPGPIQVAFVPEFVAVATPGSARPEVANDLSYLNTLNRLLPARAPPRL